MNIILQGKSITAFGLPILESLPPEHGCDMSPHLPRLSHLLRSLSSPLLPTHPSRIWSFGKTAQLFQTEAKCSIFTQHTATKLQNKLAVPQHLSRFTRVNVGLTWTTWHLQTFTSLIHIPSSSDLTFRYSILLSRVTYTNLINVSNNIFILESKTFISMWLFMDVYMDLCIHPLTCQYIFSCNFRNIRIPCFSSPIFKYSSYYSLLAILTIIAILMVVPERSVLDYCFSPFICT